MVSTKSEGCLWVSGRSKINFKNWSSILDATLDETKLIASRE
jgi:hypothetical protein